MRRRTGEGRGEGRAKGEAKGEAKDEAKMPFVSISSGLNCVCYGKKNLTG